MKKVLLLLSLVTLHLSILNAQTYTNLVSFDFTSVPYGSSPFGDLLNVGGTFYGMTQGGGANSDGVIFSYKLGTSTYTDLVNFDFATAPKGQNPTDNVIDVSGILYGMTGQGGAYNFGLIFSYNISTSTYTDLYDFNSGVTGKYPNGSLFAIGNVLYGMTSSGGTGNVGNIFSYTILTSTYTNLYSFTLATGGYPYASLVSDGSILYGMTNGGGAHGVGVIFSFNPTGNVYNDLLDFNGTSIPYGSNPFYGQLTLYNNILYGMIPTGGTSNLGLIFSYNPSTTAYTDLYNFNSGIGGEYPYGSLLLSGNTFFGMTQSGGTLGIGNIFSFNILTNTYSNLFSFTSGVNGKIPYGSLIVSGNTLYGMTLGGGASNFGNIFSFIPACTLTASAATTTNVDCYGVSDGNATAVPSGGTTPYTYSWSNGSSVASTSNPTGAALSAGSYTVTVTDNTGICTVTAGVTITQPTAALADGAPLLNSNVLCFSGNGSATAATPTGGTSPYTYAWNAGTTSTSVNNAALTAGTYTVNVSDAHGCTATSTSNITITQPTAVLADGTPLLNSNVLCFSGNGSATAATATGGTSPYTYAWNAGTTSTSATNAALTAGTYTVNVSDAHGCTATSTSNITITQPTAVLADGAPLLNSNVLCFSGNGSATAVTATGGTSPYTYAWNAGTTSTSATNAALTAGTYTVNVSDAHGCTATSTSNITITQPTAVLADGAPLLNSNVLCFSGNGSATAATATGGTSPYTYAWNAGTTSTSATNAALTAGTYTVNVSDAHGCTATSSSNITLTQPTAVLADGTPLLNSNILCFSGNGSATAATATGGTSPYTYAWNAGTTSTNATLTAGTYTVNVSDAHGCTATSSSNITLTQPAALTLKTDSVSVNSSGPCNGEAYAIVNGGKQPYTYSWTPLGETTDTIKGKCPGHYCCSVIDNNGCPLTSCVNILNITGIETISNASSISIYPDPNNGHFVISFNTEGAHSLNIYDVSGKRILTKTLEDHSSNNTLSIDMSMYAGGMYFAQIVSEKGVMNKKIIIQK